MGKLNPVVNHVVEEEKQAWASPGDRIQMTPFGGIDKPIFPPKNLLNPLGVSAGVDIKISFTSTEARVIGTGDAPEVLAIIAGGVTSAHFGPIAGALVWLTVKSVAREIGEKGQQNGCVVNLRCRITSPSTPEVSVSAN